MRLDAFVLIVLLLSGSLYAQTTSGTFIGKPLFVMAFFTLLPTVYLSLRKKKNWRKIIITTLLFGGPFAFFLDFPAEYTHSWNTIALVFPDKILDVEPIDNMLAYMIMTALAITFYQHFIQKKLTNKLSNQLPLGILFGFAAVLGLLVIFVTDPNILNVRYPYLYLGMLAITPPILLGIFKPRFIPKMTAMTPYFFVLYLTIEYFAVKYSYWIYPGNNHIGYVTFLGLTFPFEELFFWMLLYAPSLVAYYEIFINRE